ncbi:MAG: zf-HC2 domain-containing protein [Candidatus Acidiferrales bacterium]
MNSEFNGSACAEYEALLEDMLHEDLTGVDAARAADHVKTCSGCREAYDAAVFSARVFRVAGSAVERAPQPGPAFARIVMARVHEERSRADDKGIWQPLMAFAGRLAMVAALALAALLAYGAMWRAPQTTATAAMRAADSQGLFGGPAAVPASRDEVLMMVADTSHGKQ